jgi:hypothetical protein
MSVEKVRSVSKRQLETPEVSPQRLGLRRVSRRKLLGLFAGGTLVAGGGYVWYRAREKEKVEKWEKWLSEQEERMAKEDYAKWRALGASSGRRTVSESEEEFDLPAISIHFRDYATTYGRMVVSCLCPSAEFDGVSEVPVHVSDDRRTATVGRFTVFTRRLGRYYIVQIVLNPQGLQDIEVDSWGFDEQIPAERLLMLRSKLEEIFRIRSGGEENSSIE